MKPSDINDRTFNQRITNFCQALYIQKECEKANISTTYSCGKVYLAAKSKKEAFQNIIKESETYLEKLSPPVPLKPRAYYKNPNTILAVVWAGNDMKTIALVAEGYYDEFLYHVYKKEIPRPTNTKIFNTQEELETYILEELKDD